MVIYKGLPGPHICDFISREQSAANYEDGSTFQIGRIDMVANTGTYLDMPSHRFADGNDFNEVELQAGATGPDSSPDSRSKSGLAVDAAAFDAAWTCAAARSSSPPAGTATGDKTFIIRTIRS